MSEYLWQWATVQVGLPPSDFGKAVRYMLERWAGLTRFVEDPRIPLDNNAAERALRGPVVGRTNHYGSRSLRGTEVAAALYTPCETARLVGVDPRHVFCALSMRRSADLGPSRFLKTCSRQPRPRYFVSRRGTDCPFTALSVR